jgi:hypothetical protein
MDVIGFLCVSLGSRRAGACSEAGFSSANGDRAWVYYRRAAFCCVRDCWQKDLLQRIVIKKYFLFTVGSVCRVKPFITWWQTFRWWTGWNGGAEVAETTVRRLLCCWFRRTGKAMGQVYQCWWRICREINVIFLVRISHVLRLISICDLFTEHRVCCGSLSVGGMQTCTGGHCYRLQERCASKCGTFSAKLRILIFVDVSWGWWGHNLLIVTWLKGRGYYFGTFEL